MKRKDVLTSFQTADKTLSAVFFICPTGHSSLFWGQAGSRIASLSLLGLPLLANPLEVSLCPQSAHAAIPLFVPSSLFYNERYRNSYGGESDDQEIKVSTTDPESGYYVKGERGKQFAYSVHAASDAHGFVLGAIVTPGNVHDSVAFPDLLDRGLRPPET